MCLRSSNLLLHILSLIGISHLCRKAWYFHPRASQWIWCSWCVQITSAVYTKEFQFDLIKPHEILPTLLWIIQIVSGHEPLQDLTLQRRIMIPVFDLVLHVALTCFLKTPSGEILYEALIILQMAPTVDIFSQSCCLGEQSSPQCPLTALWSWKIGCSLTV